MATILDPLFPAEQADRMLSLCRGYGPYRGYSIESSTVRYAPELAQRYDAARNFVRTGGRFGRTEPVARAAARTNYLRAEYAYGDEVLVDGIEPFLHHPDLIEAARVLHGRSVIVPSIVYANLYLPGQELAVHTDVPEFRGANRRVIPQWLLVVMRHSGLFEQWRMPIATAIAYFGDAPGGELCFWPDGPTGPVETLPARHNTAVVLDTDTVFHGVDRVGGDESVIGRVGPDYEVEYRNGGTGRWEIRDQGEVLDQLPGDALRFSVSWKAYCFADHAERAAWAEHRDDIDVAVALDRLESDLRDRDRLDGERPDERTFAELLIDTYIDFPEPTTDGSQSATTAAT